MCDVTLHRIFVVPSVAALTYSSEINKNNNVRNSLNYNKYCFWWSIY